MRSIILAGLAMGCAMQLYATDLQVSAVELVGYGIFEASPTQRRAPFRATAPAADGVENVYFVDFTTEIPAELGTGFGVQYVINSTPKGGEIDVVNVIRFPGEGLQPPNGRTYTESREHRRIKVGYRDFYGYGFDRPWEMIPGEWVFEVWHHNARLLRKKFTVLPPATEDAATAQAVEE